MLNDKLDNDDYPRPGLRPLFAFFERQLNFALLFLFPMSVSFLECVMKTYYLYRKSSLLAIKQFLILRSPR
jgi:hypothetical protein